MAAVDAAYHPGTRLRSKSATAPPLPSPTYNMRYNTGHNCANANGYTHYGATNPAEATPPPPYSPPLVAPPRRRSLRNRPNSCSSDANNRCSRNIDFNAANDYRSRTLNPGRSPLSHEDSGIEEDVIRPPVRRSRSRVSLPGLHDRQSRVETWDNGIPVLVDGLLSTATVRNEAEAKSALAVEFQKHRFWKTSVIEQMHVTSLDHSIIYLYKLQSYMESRSTDHAVEAYVADMPLDSSINGPAPGPWEIQCAPRQFFIDDTQKFEVPHTSSIIGCAACNGSPKKPCKRCLGSGTCMCQGCAGTGTKSPEVRYAENVGCFSCFKPGRHSNVCQYCFGNGRNRCGKCQGNSYKYCPSCNGTGRQRRYRCLTVTFSTEAATALQSSTNGPNSPLIIPESFLVQKTRGRVLSDEVAPSVNPLTSFPIAGINAISSQLINEQRHQAAVKGRLLQQRQTLTAITATRVAYELGDQANSFYVLGETRTIYMRDSPGKSCGVM